MQQDADIKLICSNLENTLGQIEDLRLFVHVVENRSITKTADKLHIAKSAVSRRLALLEERYGAKLIDRVPGVWALTDTGRELYQRAHRVVGEADEIESDFVNASTDLKGPLSVSVPREFGINFLSHALTLFKSNHPDIQLTVDFDDRIVDLNRENYDLAIRIAGLAQVKEPFAQIGTVRLGLFASAQYLKIHPEPTSLDHLRDHNLLYFGSARRTVWEFLTSKEKMRKFEFQPFLNSNSGTFLLNATLDGLGISCLPEFIASGPAKQKRLVRLLPEIAMPERAIILLHANDRRLNRRMRIFSEAMKKACMGT